MGQSISVFELPIQLFVVGTAVGMTVAMLHYSRTRRLDLWPLIVAGFAVPAFFTGLLVEAIAALT